MYSQTEFGMIGIRVNSDSLKATKEVKVYDYATFDIKRLTRANSFIIIDETFYIAKKACDGKASRLYHIYRVSDKRHITAIPKSKEESIEIVKRKYCEMGI